MCKAFELLAGKLQSEPCANVLRSTPNFQCQIFLTKHKETCTQHVIEHFNLKFISSMGAECKFLYVWLLLSLCGLVVEKMCLASYGSPEQLAQEIHERAWFFFFAQPFMQLLSFDLGAL
jgi:hypothetical protein